MNLLLVVFNDLHKINVQQLAQATEGKSISSWSKIYDIIKYDENNFCHLNENFSQYVNWK